MDVGVIRLQQLASLISFLVSALFVFTFHFIKKESHNGKTLNSKYSLVDNCMKN
jgi:hypothetical protein